MPMTPAESQCRKPRRGRYPFLPDDPELGWMPYLWLVYLGFFTIEGLLLDLPFWAWVAGATMTAIVGASNVHFAEVRRKNQHLKAAREEVERLAKSAERERIARDLHDLLGHTLTVIAVKSELAEKLARRDPERSRREIGEVHAISREALAEVRREVQGYRAGAGAGLAQELESARRTLRSAGVEPEVTTGPREAETLAALAGPGARSDGSAWRRPTTAEAPRPRSPLAPEPAPAAGT